MTPHEKYKWTSTKGSKTCKKYFRFKKLHMKYMIPFQTTSWVASFIQIFVILPVSQWLNDVMEKFSCHNLSETTATVNFLISPLAYIYILYLQCHSWLFSIRIYFTYSIHGKQRAVLLKWTIQQQKYCHMITK